jgi:hypothetical protein
MEAVEATGAVTKAMEEEKLFIGDIPFQIFM